MISGSRLLALVLSLLLLDDALEFGQVVEEEEGRHDDPEREDEGVIKHRKGPHNDIGPEGHVHQRIVAEHLVSHVVVEVVEGRVEICG